MNFKRRREAGSHTLVGILSDKRAGDTRTSVYGLRAKGEAKW